MAMRGPRLQVGSGPWINEERSCALQIVQSEVEEFTFSARNELDWLNEHMAGIFDENQTNIAEAFKTPGKLRGKTPRTIRKTPASPRVPLTDVFSSTPNGSTNRFAQQLRKIQSPRSPANRVRSSPSPAKAISRKLQIFSPKPVPPPVESQDSGYYGSQDVIAHSALRQSFGGSSQHASDDAPIETATETASVPLSETPARNAPSSPEKALPTAQENQTKRALPSTTPTTEPPFASETALEHDTREEDEHDTPTSPQSESSSPIRPVVRKSSLNFASLPAREPLTAVKNAGARVSRTSHLDHNRASHYDRHAGGKSLGNQPWHDSDENEVDSSHSQNEMEVDKQAVVEQPSNPVLNHNKTYTQRLQAQISQLGKPSSNGSRPSKSIPNIVALQHNAVANQLANPPQSPSPKRISPTKSTPGAFPEDDDDWIDPPAPAVEETTISRPILPKSHSADVMEGIHRELASSSDQHADSASPSRVPRLPNNPMGHSKAASVSTIALSSQKLEDEMLPLMKATTIANPIVMDAITESGVLQTPSKSPSRGFRDSPLKQVKNKLSSILKSSRGLLASSAAISAEGKTSVLSPSMSRFTHHIGPSTETVVTKASAELFRSDNQPTMINDSTVTLPVAKRTRASVEREKAEKRREKEAKRMEEQMDKLEKAREQEREKARVFSKEQEKMAAMEKQLASKNTDGKLPIKETPKPVRSSPRKQVRDHEEAANVQASSTDIEMADAPALMPPPTIPRSAAPAVRGKEIKRPMKPSKDVQPKTKQAPTVIRVNTVSQNSQYHAPAGSGPSANVPETPRHLTSQPLPATSKASMASLQKKPSTQSLKSSTSMSRPKALDVAAKKKEQEEREAQRRREAKAEMDRKRAAAQEEQRRQEQQRLDLERQKQKDREQAATQAEAKQRQAMIEKAKQTRAPPAAIRQQPNGPPDFGSLSNDKPATNQTRPPSRMNSGVQRPYDDSRPVSAVLSNASKAGIKRTLGADANSDAQGQRPPSRAGVQYQAKDAKRRRTSQEHDELTSDNAPHIKGPPVRPSGGFRKELPKKSLYQNGYTNAPSGNTRELFKATVTAQHNSHSKATHPLDMAQISKGAIPFAPSVNPAGAQGGHVRPPTASSAKPPSKPAQPKSSPRYQNGENIDLPEINTDDEDDEDEDEQEAVGVRAAWTDSPDLRRALVRQETLDPSQIFGPPAPLNMEEVFNTNRERWHKFRARTSSANWSGADRLTEDDIRKDLAARDKMRREGGWSFDMSRQLL